MGILLVIPRLEEMGLWQLGMWHPSRSSAWERERRCIAESDKVLYKLMDIFAVFQCLKMKYSLLFHITVIRIIHTVLYDNALRSPLHYIHTSLQKMFLSRSLSDKNQHDWHCTKALRITGSTGLKGLPVNQRYLALCEIFPWHQNYLKVMAEVSFRAEV